MHEEQQEQELDLLEIIRMLFMRWYLIVASVFVVTVVTFIYAYVILDDVYKAETSMVVLVQTEGQTDAANFQFGQRLVDTYTELAKSNRVVSQIKDELNLSYSENTIRDMMSVSGVRDTIVIKLSVESTNRIEAANIANTAVNVMRTVSQEFEGFDNIEVLDSASVPTSPSGPNRLLYLAIGIVLGGMIGVFGVFLIEFMDKSIKNTKDIESKLNLRVLGVIPDYKTEDVDEL